MLSDQHKKRTIDRRSCSYYCAPEACLMKDSCLREMSNVRASCGCLRSCGPLCFYDNHFRTSKDYTTKLKKR